MKNLSIGQLAKKAGVKVETVRYYERQGLVPEPPRAPSRYRQYSLEAVQRIKFIKRAQGLGFTLKEIGFLLNLTSGQGADCGDVRAFAKAKIAEIDDKLIHLRRMREVLCDLAQRCAGEGALSQCPIIESLMGGDRG